MPKTILTKSKNLAQIVNGDPKVKSSPYIGVAVGTAQVNKLLHVVERFGDVGLRDRFQSVLLYDVNQDTMDRIRGKASFSKGGDSKEMQVYTPTYIPTDTGFNRDPYAYKKYFGGLSTDFNSLIDEMKDRSEALESPPQMVMMFMGFGSHSLLGWEVYGQIRKAFPQALVLIFLTTPRDPMIRRQAAKVWGEYSQNIRRTDSKTVFWPIDDFLAQDDPKINDHKLAALLATIEQAGATDSTAGTLVDAVNGLRSYSNGRWIGANIHPAFLLPTKRFFSLSPPFLRHGVVMDGKAQDLERMVSEAVAELGDPRWQLAEHESPDDLVKTYVSLPVGKSEVNLKKQRIEEWIKKSSPEDHFDKMTTDYASANFSTANSEEYLSSRTDQSRPFWQKVLEAPMMPVVVIGKLAKILAFQERKRFFCLVGQIYAIEEGFNDFETIPTLAKLAAVPEASSVREKAVGISADTDFGREPDGRAVSTDVHVNGTAMKV